MIRGITMASLAAAVLSLSMAGCASVVGGETVARYDAHSATPLVKEETVGGNYALYESGTLEPKIVVTLEPGDSLGFRRTDNGQLIAVAGDQEIPIDAAETYYWKRN